MSQDQPWALSQKAKKKNGTCSVCLKVRQLKEKDGTVHLHGHTGDRCGGSNKLPLSVDALRSYQTPVSGSNATLQSTSQSISQSTSQSTSQSASQSASLRASQLTSSLNTSVASSNATVSSQAPRTWDHPVLPCGTVKHIPKSARASCAIFLIDIIRNIEKNVDSEEAWYSLLTMGQRVLLAPKRSGARHNLASIIRKRTSAMEQQDDSVGNLEHVSNRKPRKPRARSNGEVLGSIITSKIEDGNLKAAVRIICSDESMALDNDHTYQELCQKHPQASHGSISVSPSPDCTPFQVTEQNVLEAVKSFPSGSSGGPDGLRPKHVQDILGCPSHGREALAALTALVNLLLKGKCPPDIKRILFGARLLALTKRSGGIRPIAVGYTWRRIAAKCANFYAVHKLSDLLQPTQLGVGVKGGCEAAVHASRRLIADMPAGWVMAKLDFSNAFNTLRRDRMLHSVSAAIPEILPFCLLAYQEPSVLAYGSRSILSCEGVQQGDPLGPVLFSLALHPILLSMNSPVKFGYLDDVTAVGPEQTVEDDVTRLSQESNDIGLTLNVKKCEVIITNGSRCSLPMLSSFVHVDPKDATLLGAPLLVGSSMDKALDGHCENLNRAVGRLKLISSHDSLTIIRHSLSAPKLNYMLRASPSAGHPSLSMFDDTLRKALCTIINVDFTDTQWAQASLPVSLGGLGIRSVSSLAPSAFLASAAGTRTLQDLLLANVSHADIEDAEVCRTEQIWCSLSKSRLLSGLTAHSQKNWDGVITSGQHREIVETATDSNRARILAVSAPHSGDWLNALPISSCGLRLNDDAVRVAVGLRVGARLCEPHKCICGAEVDALGTHGLNCKKGSGRIARHNFLNDIIWRALNNADVPSTKEPTGLVRTDGKRPDGLSQIPWAEGKCVTWDVTVTDTLAGYNLASSRAAAGSAAEAAARRKEDKYISLAASYHFMPIEVETLGPINKSGSDFIDDNGRRLRVLTGDHRGCLWLFNNTMPFASETPSTACHSRIVTINF